MQKFKDFPYTPDSNPTHDYHVVNKKYVDSLSSAFSASLGALSTSLSDVYGSVGAIIAGAYSVENPLRIKGNVSADSESTSLKINFESTYFSLALDAGSNSLSINIAQSGIDHDAITNFVAAEHVDHTAISAAVNDISSSVADLTSSASTLWEGIASTSTLVRNSASALVSASVETVRASLDSAYTDLTTSVSGATSTAAEYGVSVFGSASNAVSMTASTLWESLGNLTSRVTDISQSITGIWGSLSTVNEAGGGADYTASLSTLYESVGDVYASIGGSTSTIWESVNTMSTSLETLYTSVGEIRASLSNEMSTTAYNLSVAIGSLSNDMSASMSNIWSAHMSLSDDMSSSISIIWGSLGGLTSRVTDISQSVTAIWASVSTVNEAGGGGGVTTASLENIWTSISGSTTIVWSALNTMSVWLPSVGVSIFTSATARASTQAESIGLSVFSSATNRASTFADSVGLSVFTSATAASSTKAEGFASSVHTDLTTSVSGAVSTAAERFSTTGSVGLLWDTVTAAWTSITNVHTYITALSTSVSQYQSAMLTSISTNAIFVGSKISMSSGASINCADFIRFNIDSSTPMIVSAGRVNFYSPIECISTSLDLNDRGLTASSISISAIRGNSISVSNLYATSISTTWLHAASASVSNDLYVGNAVDIGNFLAAGNLASPSSLSAVCFVNEFTDYTNNKVAVDIEPLFSPSGVHTTDKELKAVGGYSRLTQTTSTAVVGVFGLDYGGCYIPSGCTAGGSGMQVYGIRVIGLMGYLGAATANKVYGLYVKPTWDIWGCSFTVTDAFGAYIEVPGHGTNKYQAVLASTGTGTGIWFGGTSGKRLYSDGTDIFFTGMGSGSGNYPVEYTTATGKLTYDTSSMRYKENIREYQLPNPETLLCVEPKQYKRKDTGCEEVGYIAEDLDGLGLRPLVIYDEQNRPDAINRKNMVMYLVEIIKQQEHRIKQLEKEMGEIWH